MYLFLLLSIISTSPSAYLGNSSYFKYRLNLALLSLTPSVLLRALAQRSKSSGTKTNRVGQKLPPPGQKLFVPLD